MSRPQIDITTLTEHAELANFTHIALAVSGGSDSMALLYRIAHWRESVQSSKTDLRVPEITVLTVDHGLRHGSRADAKFVYDAAGQLGVPCHILTWEGEKPKTGIQAAARAARYELLTAFCRKHSIGALLTAHHGDDQAETLLMNLARGSGLDGLCGIAAELDLDGVRVLRPFLKPPARTKADLEEMLLAHGGTWREDPSNRDERFERVRLRKSPSEGLSHLERILAQSPRLSARLSRSRAALEHYTDAFLSDAAHLSAGGYGRIDRTKFGAAPEEIRIRALRRLVDTVGGGAKSPRLESVENLVMPPDGGRDATLGGCVVRWADDRILVLRETGGGRGPQPATLAPGQTLDWDRRFRLTLDAEAAAPVQLQALGHENLAAARAIVAERSGNVPNAKILAQPGLAATLLSVWRDAALAALPYLNVWVAPELEKELKIAFIGAFGPARPRDLR